MLKSAKRDRLRRAGQTDGSKIWYCWPKIRIGSLSPAEGESDGVVVWLREKRLNEKRPRTGKSWGLNLKKVFVILKKIDMFIVFCFFYKIIREWNWTTGIQIFSLTLYRLSYPNRAEKQKNKIKIKIKEGENRTPNLGFGGPRFTTKLLPWVQIVVAQNRVERLFSGHEPTVLPVTPPRWTKIPPTRIELVFPPWKGAVLPLDEGGQNKKKSKKYFLIRKPRQRKKKINQTPAAEEFFN